MSEEFEQMDLEGGEPLEPISHRRIITLMVVIIVAGSTLGFLFAESGFGSGILLGGAMSIVSYLWLKGSLGSMLAAAVQGERREFHAVRFFLRYVVIGSVLFTVYLSEAFPMMAVLLGLASFAGAVIVEGVFRAVSGTSSNKEKR